MSLIIHASNVHRGGGKALLLPLLTAGRNQVAVKALLVVGRFKWINGASRFSVVGVGRR